MATLTRTALRVNAAVGIVCTVAAAAMMSLALTRPEGIAAAIAQHEYGTIVSAVGAELVRWLHALLHFI